MQTMKKFICVLVDIDYYCDIGKKDEKLTSMHITSSSTAESGNKNFRFRDGTSDDIFTIYGKNIVKQYVGTF